MRNIITILFISLGFISFSQDIVSIEEITDLVSDVDETSGLILVNGHLFTHNDSGDNPIVYEIDTLSGEIIREVTINNAENIDWEDITQDEYHVYLGDFGNNDGDRMDLTIFKFPKNAILNNDEINPQVITYSYEDQTDFTVNHNNNNFDCEAIICYGDSLFLFSKNWENKRTKLYSIPKYPGNYVAKKNADFNVNGLITAATYDQENNIVVLLGYNYPLKPFVWRLSNFTDTDFFGGINERFTLSIPVLKQVEAICYIRENEYFFSSEKGMSSSAKFFKLSFSTMTQVDNIAEEKIQLYPNPVHDTLHLKNINSKIKRIRIFDSNSKKIKRYCTKKSEFDVSFLPIGIYFFEIKMKRGIKVLRFVKVSSN